jgi:hypothetical protein
VLPLQAFSKLEFARQSFGDSKIIYLGDLQNPQSTLPPAIAYLPSPREPNHSLPPWRLLPCSSIRPVVCLRYCTLRSFKLSSSPYDSSTRQSQLVKLTNIGSCQKLALRSCRKAFQVFSKLFSEATWHIPGRRPL